MIITVISQKGGAGKTTTATNIAAELHARAQVDGGSVMLVDADPQRSAADWASVGLEQGYSVPTTVAMGADMHKRTQLPQLADQYHHVVIDTPPGGSTDAGKITRSSLLVADLALVVCRPSPHDLNAIGRTLDLLDEVRETLREDLVAAMVIAQRPPQRIVIAEDSIRALREEDSLRICANELYSRAAYQYSAAAGQGVTITEPRSKAAEEIRLLVDELVALVAASEGGDHVQAA